MSTDNVSLYGQDIWRVKKGFSVTYGVRWDLAEYPKEKNNLYPTAVIGLDNPATMTFAPANTPLWRTPRNNLAPRLGFSYQISKAPGRETVMRGGFGMFYDQPYGFTLNAFANSWPSALRKNIAANTPFPYNLAVATPLSLLTATPPATQLTVADPNLKLPLIYQWNLALDRSVGANQVLSLAYVGAAGRRLLRQELLVNPNPNFLNVFITRNSGTSDYNALQAQFRRRLSRGWQALASYTWAHSIDTASNDSSAVAPGTAIPARVDRASSDFDVRHSFNAAVTYNLASPSLGTVPDALLRDWSIDSVFTARSATPVNVFTTTDVLGLGVSSVSRPDLVPGAPLYVSDSAVAGGKRFDRAAFVIPPANSHRQGTLGRNALRGFSVYQLDFALRRQFSFTEKLKVQFKCEMFNALNHPNFADPSGSLGTDGVPNAFFGLSTTMFGRSLGSGGVNGGLNPLYQIGGPRSIQLGLKILF
ncbi:MAG: TonB-dependent receptor domain-containing protein [Pyrinomonadaceae bacterium]